MAFAKRPPCPAAGENGFASAAQSLPLQAPKRWKQLNFQLVFPSANRAFLHTAETVEKRLFRYIFIRLGLFFLTLALSISFALGGAMSAFVENFQEF
jgi:hypothetical protein